MMDKINEQINKDYDLGELRFSKGAKTVSAICQHPNGSWVDVLLKLENFNNFDSCPMCKRSWNKLSAGVLYCVDNSHPPIKYSVGNFSMKPLVSPKRITTKRKLFEPDTMHYRKDLERTNTKTETEIVSEAMTQLEEAFNDLFGL